MIWTHSELIILPANVNVETPKRGTHGERRSDLAVKAIETQFYSQQPIDRVWFEAITNLRLVFYFFLSHFVSMFQSEQRSVNFWIDRAQNIFWRILIRKLPIRNLSSFTFVTYFEQRNFAKRNQKKSEFEIHFFFFSANVEMTQN